MQPSNYAGDVSSRQAYELLQQQEDAVLIDVRTPAEWAFVGRADIEATGRPALFISWQTWPTGAQNPDFVADVEAAGVPSEATVLLLCRSGQRSRSAAVALTAAGFARCYNIADGFEGPKDGAEHRGTQTGWKVAGLPWVQD